MNIKHIFVLVLYLCISKGSFAQQNSNIQGVDAISIDGTYQISLDSIAAIQEDSDTIDLMSYLIGGFRVKKGGVFRLWFNLHMLDGGWGCVEDSATLIIDRARLSNIKLTLKPGSTLQIINGGVLKSHDGFHAPSGVNVFINKGSILR